MSNRYVLLVVVVLTLNAAGTSDAQGVAADFALTNLLDQPRGVAVDEVNRALYVADTVNRVLRYDSIDTISATTEKNFVVKAAPQKRMYDLSNYFLIARYQFNPPLLRIANQVAKS